MIIGVPKEIKNNEKRVAMTPAGVCTLVQAGHTVLIATGAGEGSGFTDEEYAAQGAKIAPASEALSKADLVVKVKEYDESEYQYLHNGQIVFSFLHLANDQPFADALTNAKASSIAYETVTARNGRGLPLLSPMSEVAGRMSIQIGAYMLQQYMGGSGVLLGGVPGVLPAKVVVVGGGNVGWQAARVARGMGASVKVFDISKDRLNYIDEVSGGSIRTVINNPYDLGEALKEADLVIGAVLVPGSRTPKIVKEDMVKNMKKGSVIVDVAIDQGGCVETSTQKTTHLNPCFVKYDVVHYAVPNIPGAVPRTATMALVGATLPYVLSLANKGLGEALKSDPGFMNGLNTHAGKYTYKGVADSLGFEYTDPNTLF